MCIYIHFQGLYDINLINLFPTSYPRRNGAIPLIHVDVYNVTSDVEQRQAIWHH